MSVRGPIETSSTLTSPLVLFFGKVTSVSGFDGLTQDQAGGITPPDVSAATGPTDIVEMVNVGGEIFTKQGSSVSTFDLTTFFRTDTDDSVTDPKIIYDAMSSRWFASLQDSTTNKVQVAVSVTNDPTGSWNIYSLGFTDCLDQPTIGINDDKFAVSVNHVDCQPTGVQYVIIDKADLVKGVASPRLVESQPDPSLFSLHPVQSLSSTSTLYMVSAGAQCNTKQCPSNQVTLVSFTGSVPRVVKSTVSLGIQTTHIPPGGVQPETNDTVDTGDARVQDAAWHKGKLWLTLNDACTPRGDTTVRSCVRLDQLDTTANTVRQDFDFGDRGIYYFYPALRMDSSGNLVFICGFSSANTFPSLLASGQAVGATVDTVDRPVILKSGSGAAGERYGDYFGAGVDPANPTKVWVAGEYTIPVTWSTFIAQISRPPETTISSAIDGNGATVHNGGSTLSSSIQFKFTGISSVGIAGFECSLDRSAFSPCSSPVTLTNLLAGKHVFQVRAVDTSGNRDPTPAVFTWTILTPAQAINDLIGLVKSMHLSEPTNSALIARLDAALQYLSQGSRFNAGACGELVGFTVQVQGAVQHNEITPAQAVQLIKAAQAIEKALGC